jgi:hypothetical protein
MAGERTDLSGVFIVKAYCATFFIREGKSQTKPDTDDHGRITREENLEKTVFVFSA